MTSADPAASLQRSLGLNEAEFEAFAPLFAEALSKFGMDGRSVLADLSSGKPLAKALAVPDGTADLLYARAHHWFGVGRFDKAEALFRTLCVLDGNKRDHWLGYGICLKVRSQAEASAAALLIAAEKDPSSAVPYYHLLDLAIRSGAWGEAQNWMTEFDARKSEGISPLITSEVDRYRKALSLRAAAASRSTP